MLIVADSCPQTWLEFVFWFCVFYKQLIHPKLSCVYGHNIMLKKRLKAAETVFFTKPYFLVSIIEETKQQRILISLQLLYSNIISSPCAKEGFHRRWCP